MRLGGGGVGVIGDVLDPQSASVSDNDGGAAGGGAGVSGWVLLASRLRWREKLSMAQAALVLPVVSGAISVPDSALRTTMWDNGVPLAIFLVTMGLTICANNPRRTVITIVLLALGWGSFALVRNDGFDW